MWSSPRVCSEPWMPVAAGPGAPGDASRDAEHGDRYAEEGPQVHRQEPDQVRWSPSTTGRLAPATATTGVPSWPFSHLTLPRTAVRGASQLLKASLTFSPACLTLA